MLSSIMASYFLADGAQVCVSAEMPFSHENRVQMTRVTQSLLPRACKSFLVCTTPLHLLLTVCLHGAIPAEGEVSMLCLDARVKD